MRAIIISDSDAKALVDRLMLCKMQESNSMLRYEQIRITLDEQMTDEHKLQTLVDVVHRAFYYRVVSWLQEQGASVT